MQNLSIFTDPDRIFSSPDGAKSDYKILKDTFVSQRDIKQSALAAGGLSKKTVGEFIEDIVALNSVINDIPDLGEPQLDLTVEQASSMSVEELRNIITRENSGELTPEVLNILRDRFVGGQ